MKHFDKCSISNDMPPCNEYIMKHLTEQRLWGLIQILTF